MFGHSECGECSVDSKAATSVKAEETAETPVDEGEGCCITAVCEEELRDVSL